MSAPLRSDLPARSVFIALHPSIHPSIHPSPHPHLPLHSFDLPIRISLCTPSTSPSALSFRQSDGHSSFSCTDHVHHSSRSRRHTTIIFPTPRQFPPLSSLRTPTCNLIHLRRTPTRKPTNTLPHPLTSTDTRALYPSHPLSATQKKSGRPPFGSRPDPVHVSVIGITSSYLRWSSSQLSERQPWQPSELLSARSWPWFRLPWRPLRHPRS